MRRRPAALLALPLLLSACTGGSSTVAAPAPTPSCDLTGTVVPERCVSTATPSPDAYSNDRSKIPAIVPERPLAGQTVLGTADNTSRPDRTTGSFTVTVPAGKRIGSEIYCRGNGMLTLTTVPDSNAFQSITCNGGQGLQSTLTAESATPVTTATTYTVTVKTSAPARWYARVYGTTVPVTG